MKHAPSLLVTMFLFAGCNGASTPVETSASANPPNKETTVVSDPSSSEKPLAENSDADKAKEKKEKVIKTEAEWKRLLTTEQFRVLRMKGTERPYTNKFDEHFQPGTYSCAACGQVLFESKAKFNSGCGWPAFYAAKAKDHVNLHRDTTLGMIRTEVTCARCDSHLGHIFDDAPQTPTGQRYCINSVSLKFTPAKDKGKTSDGAKESPDKK